MYTRRTDEKHLTALLVSSALATILASASATAQSQGQGQESQRVTNPDTSTILGMTIGKMFNYPKCKLDKFGVVPLEYMQNGPPEGICWESEYGLIRVWAKGQAYGALPIVEIYASLKNGILDSLRLYTTGIPYQDLAMSALKEKFGEPLLFDKVPHQNGYGAQFIGYDATWNTQTVHVRFKAVDEAKKDRGVVEVQDIRSYNASVKSFDELQRKQPKFYPPGLR